MAFKARHLTGTLAGLLALGVAMLALTAIWNEPGMLATKIVLFVLMAVAMGLIWHQTRQTNLVLADFVAALDQNDFSQAFGQTGKGAGFDEVGQAFDKAMQRLHRERSTTASESHFAGAMLDETPTPLLAVSPDGRVELANKAARQLFPDCHDRTIASYAPYGVDLVDALMTIAPATRRVCRLTIDGVPQRAMLAATMVERRQQPWRIMSIDVIQGALDAAEVAAQTDLVRVLTHEIMNSMTPVTSLAGSAAALMNEVDAGNDPAITDARLAVEALARRAGGILHFVESYREFSRMPSLTITTVDARAWTMELARVFSASPQGAHVALTVEIAPPHLRVDLDADLMGQVVLNLLKNAGEAAQTHSAAPRVAISVSHMPTGRVSIVVTDNGPGVPDALADDVFLPFFTTKEQGTGVGLSFARQIVLLHQGAISMVREAGDFGFEIIL